MCEHLRVQGRYTIDLERVRDYSLLGIDLHVLHYFCVNLTCAYFFHGFSLIAEQSTTEHALLENGLLVLVTGCISAGPCGRH